MSELHLKIGKQQRGLISAGVILHHDNAPPHTVAAKINRPSNKKDFVRFIFPR